MKMRAKVELESVIIMVQSVDVGILPGLEHYIQPCHNSLTLEAYFDEDDTKLSGAEQKDYFNVFILPLHMFMARISRFIFDVSTSPYL